MLRNIDFLVSKGMLFATLSGGECLLHNNFQKIYKYIHQKGVLITILTNGSLINDEIMNLFSKYKPYKIEISIYAKDENTMKKIQSNQKSKSKI